MAVGVLILSAVYLTRTVVILQTWTFWKEILLPFTIYYLLFSGILWGCIWLILGAGIWLGYRKARMGLMVFAVLFTLVEWAQRLGLALINGFAVNLPFVALTWAITLGWVFWILSRPTVKQFFGDDS
jgi:hypothetical protein